MTGTILWRYAIAFGAAALHAGAAAAGDVTAKGAQSSTGDARPPHFVARQHIDAKIARLDAGAGVVVLATPSGQITLPWPHRSDLSIKKGDHVPLEAGLLRSMGPASAARPRPSRPERDSAIVREYLPGRVTLVDRSAGALAVRTSAGKITFGLPGNLLASFKKGDAVPVELAVLPQGAGQPESERDTRSGVAALLLSIFGKR